MSTRRRHSNQRHGKGKSYKGKFIALIIVILALLAFIIFMIVSTLSASSQPKKQTSTEDTTKNTAESEKETEPEIDSNEQKVLDQIAAMSTEEKVAQLFFVTPEELTGVDVVVQAGDTTKKSLSDYPVGGIIYFSQNITSSDQLTKMIQSTSTYSKTPLFFGVDEEGGSLVARIAGSGLFDVPTVDDMATIGASGDTSKAYNVGTTIGGYLSEIGFNVDFAPDSDVLVNPDNTAIGVRSFGADPEVDADMVAQVVKGLQENNVSATLKHFPGHGATTTDSHKGAAIVDRSLDELKSTEFLPFSAGIKEGANFVMVGHLQLPQILSNDTPASLSSKVVTDILRGDLGFQKIIITDSMSMEAITDFYEPDEAAIDAIQAGADMILMPSDFKTSYEGVLEAVNDGTITEDRLNESVKRILTVKLDL